MPSDAVDPLALFFDQASKHGPFAVILDFTKVTELGMQLRDWPQFAADRRAIRGIRRVLVAPPNDIFVPLRLYGTQRGGSGGDSDVVSTRADAYRMLRLAAPAFEPMAPA
jgi:hypothetical protein